MTMASDKILATSDDDNDQRIKSRTLGDTVLELCMARLTCTQATPSKGLEWHPNVIHTHTSVWNQKMATKYIIY